MTRRAIRIAAPVLFVVVFGACSGQGCSCVQPLKGGFPVAERHESAIQLRATQSLFEYLGENGAPLVGSLLPGGTTFEVPPSGCGSVPEVCCGTPAPKCGLSFDFKSLALTPKAPNQLHLSTDVALKTTDNLKIGIGIGTCYMSLDTTRSGGGTMNISADITFPINATTDNTEISLSNATVTGIDDGDLKTDEDGSTFLVCTVLSIGKGAVISALESQVASQLSGIVGGQTCMKCTDKTDCNAFATDCKSGTCVGADGTTCIQEVGVEGKLGIGSLLASVSPGNTASIDFLAALGGYATADTGLSLGMLGGGLSDPHSSCVPQVPAPESVTVAPSPTFQKDTLPDGTTPFHVGIGIHKSHLDRLGWAAFDAGALCLDIGSSTVALLTAKTIGLVIPSLSDLTHGEDAPMFLVARPKAPPTFTLGKGTFKDDDSGKRVIDEPLLDVNLPDFHLDFYAFVDEHYVRVMTLNADVVLPVGLDLDADHKIVPILGDLTKAFTNVTVTNSELLAEAPEALAKTFPMLLGIAGSQITSAISPIALPAIMGINLEPLSITATDADSDGALQFLSIFTNLSLATTESLAIDTRVRMARLELPSTREFAVDARREAVPRAWLELGSEGLADRQVEYSYNVDGSGWSPFSTGTRLSVTHPLLWMQGRHYVDVRARAVGLPATLDRTPARIELLVDTVAPTGGFDVAGDRLVVVGQDNVSPAAQLRYRFRVDAREWSAWLAPSAEGLALPAAVAGARVEVEAQDEAGNVGHLEFHGRTTTPPSAGGCGCDLGAAGSEDRAPAGPLALLAADALLLAARRRRAGVGALLALAAAGALPAAGCNRSSAGSLGPGDYVDAVDEVGRWHDVALRDGVLHLSAYDDSVGDLVYARVEDPSQPIQWQVIDGVDRDAPVAVEGGPRYGILDPGPDVGRYSSIALTRSGAPRIAYFDVTNRALKFASGPGTFETQTVDVGAGSAQAGLFAALALDDNDVPSIAYLVTGLPDGNNGFASELRLATATSATPKEGDWTITTVDTTAISCAGLCASGTACIQTAMVNGMENGDPSISTCVAVDATPCATECSDTQACIAGVCTDELTVGAPELPEGIGLFTQARRVNGALTLVYYDHSQGDLKLAVQNGATFAISLVDGGDPSTDVGQFASAQAGPDGTLHVAYVDAIGDRLLYKTVSGGMPSATPEVIDDGLRDDGPHPVGAGAALLVGASGPRVVYQDQQLSDLMQARRSDASWTRSEVSTGTAGYGWWPHLVSDGTTTWLTQLVYDRANAGALGTLQISTLPE